MEVEAEEAEEAEEEGTRGRKQSKRILLTEIIFCFRRRRRKRRRRGIEETFFLFARAVTWSATWTSTTSRT